MRAKKKPIQQITAESLGVDITPQLVTVEVGVGAHPLRRALLALCYAGVHVEHAWMLHTCAFWHMNALSRK
jgi:hypothetical protein